MKALVWFHDDNDHPLNFLLKPGFRHCACAILVDGFWIGVDGMDGRPDIRLLAREAFDLETCYREAGYRVVATERGPEPIRTPLALANCVGVTKAVLCIRAPFVWTPYQLYRHLKEGRHARSHAPGLQQAQGSTPNSA